MDNQPRKFASAGNAVEIDPNEPQPGLYRDPQSGKEIGILDSNQAAAAVRVGFVLVPGGDPHKTQSEMDRDERIRNGEEEEVAETESTDDESATDESEAKVEPAPAPEPDKASVKNIKDEKASK